MNLQHQATQLFIDKLGAFEGRLKQTSNLLLNQHFKSLFWHEQARTHRWGVLDSSLDVLFSQVFEWVDFSNDVSENLVEDKVDARATLALCRDIFDKITLQLVAVHLNILADQIKDEWTLVLFVCNNVFLVISQQFPFFLLDSLRYLFWESRNAVLNVGN